MEGGGVGGDGDGGLDAGRGVGGDGVGAREVRMWSGGGRCSASASWLRGTSVLTVSIGQMAT